jgi:hypothetical protein
MRAEQGPLQWQGFRLAGLLCLGLAIVKLTLERQWSWWRVLLPLWTMVGHNALYIVVGFVWLHFVDDGEAGVNEEAPDRYQLAALLCFFLFVDNLVGRLERGQPPAWQWLGSGQWQLLLPLRWSYPLLPASVLVRGHPFRFSFPLKKLIP